MDYTTEAKRRIKDIVHDAYGDYIKNVQLSTEDYFAEQERIARTILDELATPDMYETLQFTVRQIEELHKLKGDFGLTNAILGLAKQTLAKADSE